MKSIDAWHTRLTPLCYLSFAAAGGALLGGLFNLIAGAASLGFSLAAVTLLAVAWAAKIAWWRRLRSLKPTSTPESATGSPAHTHPDVPPSVIRASLKSP